MEKIILWLRNVEHMAGDVYRAAALELADDEEFSSFLTQMAEDEAEHFRFMSSAAQFVAGAKEDLPSDIKIDLVTRVNVETPFQNMLNLMADRSITRQEIVDCIVKAEFSELNHLFVYVFKTLHKFSKSFQYPAASIQAHIERIEAFLHNLPSEIKVPADLGKLPRIWEERILVVEDNESLRELLSGLLGNLGNVERASNGQEGLEKTKEGFFNLVLSAVDMPVMDGIELFQKAKDNDPKMARNFLFLAKETTSEALDYLREHNLPFLEKPFGIQQLLEKSQSIIKKSS